MDQETAVVAGLAVTTVGIAMSSHFWGIVLCAFGVLLCAYAVVISDGESDDGVGELGDAD
jgi:hypothetical protein